MNDETATRIGGMPVRASVALLGAALLLVGLLLFGSQPAFAAAYIVDTTSDASLTACTGAAGDCSLRGAITNASANGGGDTITFDPTFFSNSITSPDTTGNVGQYTSMAIDALGNPVVSYINATNFDLMVMHCNDANCAGGNESITSPDAGVEGEQTSLALDASGFPVVSYQDVSTFDLKILHCNDVNCSGGGDTISSVDTGGAVGYYSSLTLDTSGFPVVSYWDSSNSDLKVLHCGNANCTSGNSITSPDSAGNVGFYTSLALDASGFPVVSYYDSSNGDLKVLHCGNANCTSGNSLTSPDTTGNVGQYTSLALDASGFPVVTSWNATDGDLRLVHCGNANCTSGNSVISADSAGSVGQNSSVVLDATGFPVVSYLDSNANDLKVLHCGNANCTSGNSFTLPDTTGTVGLYTSLVLDASGNPVISYYDLTNQDLKVIHCVNVTCARGIGTLTLGSALPALSNSGDLVDAAVGGVEVNGVTGAFDCFTISGSSNTILGIDAITGCLNGVKITGATNIVGGINPGEGSGSACTDTLDGDSDGYTNDGCAQSGATAESGAQCSFGNATDDDTGDADGLVNDGCPARGYGNVIYGNSSSGVLISGEAADNNELRGNYVGTNADGTTASANFAAGVLIDGGADGAVIGGSVVGARNIISGNTNYGALISGAGTTGNTLRGNYIGTDAAGASGIPGTYIAVLIESGASSNTIGGTTAGERNVITSGTWGVQIMHAGTTGNTVSGNYIGVKATGHGALGNNVGVSSSYGASGNTIGGSTTPGSCDTACNVISGNLYGVYMYAAGADSNVVRGNFIGTNAAGTVAIPNTNGVWIAGGASSNTVGGTVAAHRNVISGNTADGVFIGSAAETVTNDCVLNQDNDNDGFMNDGCPQVGAIAESGGQCSNTVNDDSGDDSVVNDGCPMIGTTSSNTLQGNYIGLNAAGAAALANGDDGIEINGNGSSSNTIGGVSSVYQNVISGNIAHGVHITGAGSTGNTISANYIGTNVAGTAAIENGADGVRIEAGASSNTVGGVTPGHRNLISGNDQDGVTMTGSGSSNNIVKGNYIGTNAAGTGAIANFNGVVIDPNGTGNTVGGSSAGDRNVVSGNLRYGVVITGSPASGTVAGNYVGTDATGTADLGNGFDGVRISAGASGTIGGNTGTTPGGPCTGSCNVISGNALNGISILSGSNIVRGNYVGTNAAGTAAIGNSLRGIEVESSGNTIGGTSANDRNVVGGSGDRGIAFEGAISGNIVRGNYSGVGSDGVADVGNALQGIWLASTGGGETVGGTAAGAGNVVAWNDQHGIGVVSNSHLVQGNTVRNNALTGVYVQAALATVGGTAPGAGNTIHDNGGDGIFMDTGSGVNNQFRGNSIYNNGGLGIDRHPDGLSGSVPTMTSVTYDNSTRTLTVSGSSFTAGTPIDVFATDTPDPSGSGEGRQFLGTVTPGGTAYTFLYTGVPAYGYISATGTDASSGTSEFSITFDADVDGDGFPTSTDNCDVTFNPFQIDHDGDGVGDACDSLVRNRFTASQSSLRTEFTVAAGDALTDETRFIAPWDFQTGVSIGAQIGEVDLAFLLRSATACDTGFSQADIKLLSASVNNSSGNVVSTANILADTDADTIVDGVEGYPSFLNTIYDPARRTNVNEDGDGSTDEDGSNGIDTDGDTRVDEDGAGSPPAPHARYFGRYGASNYFQVVVFEEDADDRYRIETWFNDPTGFPNGISCAPLEFSQVIFTTSVTNTDPTPDVTGGQAVLADPPSGSGTRVVRGQAVDRPDLDGDLQDNSVDNCDLVANTDQTDTDADGIGNVCEPASGPCSATAVSDCDSDGIFNWVDNCSTIANASQSEAEIRTPRTFGVSSVDDSIGDACDPNLTLPGDIGTIGIDEYSDPICITGGGVVDTDSDGWCAANDPNDSLATIGPENEGLVLPAVTGTFARGLCNNGYDDDGTGGTDFADSDCADADGDFVPDNVDICDAAADPLQLNADADIDAQGDNCEDLQLASLKAVSSSAGANSELRGRLVEPAPKMLHDSNGGIVMHTDPDWTIASDGMVANGAIRETFSGAVTAAVSPGHTCKTTLPLNFTLLDATTSTASTVAPGSNFSGLLADTSPANGVPDGADKLPDFLLNLSRVSARVDNDGDFLRDEDPVDGVNNDLDALTDEDGYDFSPIARLFGSASLGGVNTVLNVVINNPVPIDNDGDALQAEDPPDFINNDGDTLTDEDPAEGYTAVFVFGNPTAPASPGTIAAVCTPWDIRVNRYGISVDNPASAANEGGTKLLTNTSPGSTERFLTAVTTQSDHDGDVIENRLDTCTFDADNDNDGTNDQADASPWNPRLVAPPGDTVDNDGIPLKCDGNPGGAGRVTDLAICNPATDCDLDGVNNTADNCFLLQNSGQQDADEDGIGDVCDPNTVFPNGTIQRVQNGTPECIAGTDADDDGYCLAVDVSDANDRSVPETSAFDPIVCHNLINDDAPQDTLIDLLDPGCGDLDGDGVLNQDDNCPGYPPSMLNNANPGQEDSDFAADGPHPGEQPWSRSESGVVLGDPATVVGQPWSRSDQFGGDVCDPDDDSDLLPDGNEPTPCRLDPDCDDDYMKDWVEWSYSSLNPSAPSVCLHPQNADASAPAGADYKQNPDGDALFTYGEALIGTNPCTNTNSTGDFAMDNCATPPATCNGAFCAAPNVCDGDGYRSGVERYIGTNPGDRCGLTDWPADLVAGLISTNKVNIVDMGNFIGPVRRLNTSLGHPNFGRRWDLVPGSAVGEMVQIGDLAALTSGATGFPPMLGGMTKAFNGPSCPDPN